MNYENSAKQLDTTIEILTPENIQFSYRLAGPFLRMIIFAFDSMFLGFFFVLISLLGAFFFQELENLFQYADYSDFYNGLIFVIYSFLFWFGNGFLEAVLNGQTFGKMIFGVRVLTVDGQPIRFRQAMLRNVVRMADILFGPFIVIIMCVNDKMMRFGDIAAGTIVVLEDMEQKNRAVIRFKHPEIQKILDRIPSDFEISPELSRALSIYVHRRTAVSPQRRWEIAYPLALRLTKKMKWSGPFHPDLVLCGVHQWNLNQ